MNKVQTIGLLAGAASLGISCGAHLPPAALDSETRNIIALCTGGYSASAKLEIEAEFKRRGIGFITEVETEEKGVDTFAFGEQRGQVAANMYNAYVMCIVAERKARSTPVNNTQTPRWKDHEIGVTRSGEPVVQTPMPGQARAGDEIQLQIVTANGDSWSSKGTPRWEGWCDSGALQQNGSATSYTYRFIATRQGQCQIILYATIDSGGFWWYEIYSVQVGK